MLILICFLSLFYLSNIHCPEAPYIPVSSTAATVSSGEAPVMRAEGTAKADEIDRWEQQKEKEKGIGYSEKVERWDAQKKWIGQK